MAVTKLGIELTVDKLKLVRGLADARANVGKLGEAAKKATSEVAAAARAVRASANAGPPNPALLRNLESLKAAAAAAKAEFQAGRAQVDNLGRALAAQGVNVGKSTAEFVRMKNAMAGAARAGAQLNSQLSSQAAASMASGIPTATASRVSSNDQRIADKTSESVDRLTGKLRVMGYVSAGVFAAQQYVVPYLAALGRVSDAYLKFNAQLTLATRNGGDLAQAQADVARIAAAAQAGIAETANLYARLTASVGRLGIGQAEVAKVTEVVALSLRVSGATAAESASAILQLSQAFGSGVLRGEEFNAVNEASPRLMQALADAMGRPREELRKMAENGELTSRVLALALPKALGALREEAAAMPQTVGGAFTNLSNQFTLFIGRVNSGVGVFSVFAGAINALAANLQNVLAGVAAAAAFYVTRKLAGVVQIRAAEAAAARAQLAEVAARTAAEAAQVRARLTGLASIVAAERGAAAAAAATGAAQATAAATASRALAGVSTALGGLLRLLGGPVGLAATIGAAALAWFGFRESGTKALDDVIARQREFLRLQNKTPGEQAAAADPRSAELDEAEKQLAALRAQVERTRRGIDLTERARPRSPSLPGMRKNLADQIKEMIDAQNGLARERLKIKADLAASARADAEREKHLKQAMDDAAKGAKHAREAAGKAGKGDQDPIASLLAQTDIARLAEYERLMALLIERQRAGKISAEQYAQAVSILLQQSFGDKVRDNARAMAEEAEFMQEVDRAGLDAARENLENRRALAAADAERMERAEAIVEGIRRETVEIGMTRQERALAVDLLALEESGIDRQSEAYRVLREAIVEANAEREKARGIEARNAAAAKASEEAWKNFASGLQSSIAGALVNMEGGFRGFVRSIVDLFRKTLAQSIAKSISDAILKGMNSGGGGGFGGGSFGGLFSGLLKGLFGGIGKLFGFAEGGYTGPGGKYQPAGTVHAGEYVFSAASVRSLGLDFLHNLHAAAKGGFVPTMPRLAYAEGGPVRLPAAQAMQQPIRIVNAIGPDVVHDHLNTPAGERLIVNIIGHNARAVRAALGG